MELFSTVLNTEASDESKIKSLTALVYLCTNKVAPDFKGIEVGVGEGLVIKALTRSTGHDKDAIQGEYDELGDLGLGKLCAQLNQ